MGQNDSKNPTMAGAQKKKKKQLPNNQNEAYAMTVAVAQWQWHVARGNGARGSDMRQCNSQVPEPGASKTVVLAVAKWQTGPVAQRHRDTATQIHSGTDTQWHRDTVAQ
jgi:hypothetical protein